eukprot:scaffold280185_cov53-Prasinocladus_malaysianus.AAC.1
MRQSSHLIGWTMCSEYVLAHGSLTREHVGYMEQYANSSCHWRALSIYSPSDAFIRVALVIIGQARSLYIGQAR